MKEPPAPHDQDKTLQAWTMADGRGDPGAGWKAIHAAGIFAGNAGTPPAEVVRSLMLEEVLKTPCDVMEIGIGAGALTRALASQGHRVVAVDVSPAALWAVAPVCRMTALASDLPSLPAASLDAAVSFLCFQHIADAPLDAMLKEIRRILRPTGLLAFQCAMPLYHPFPDWVQRDLDAGFLHLRDHKAMADMLTRAGFSSIISVGKEPYDEIGIDWEFVWAS